MTVSSHAGLGFKARSHRPSSEQPQINRSNNPASAVELEAAEVEIELSADPADECTPTNVRTLLSLSRWIAALPWERQDGPEAKATSQFSRAAAAQLWSAWGPHTVEFLLGCHDFAARRLSHPALQRWRRVAAAGAELRRAADAVGSALCALEEVEPDAAAAVRVRRHLAEVDSASQRAERAAQAALGPDTGVAELTARTRMCAGLLAALVAPFLTDAAAAPAAGAGVGPGQEERASTLARALGVPPLDPPTAALLPRISAVLRANGYHAEAAAAAAAAGGGGGERVDAGQLAGRAASLLRAADFLQCEAAERRLVHGLAAAVSAAEEAAAAAAAAAGDSKVAGTGLCCGGGGAPPPPPAAAAAAAMTMSMSMRMLAGMVLLCLSGGEVREGARPLSCPSARGDRG